ncbi:MAG: alcohol dehydrogenase catalytic domain-containing protein [Acidimicrobiia bacterium]
MPDTVPVTMRAAVLRAPTGLEVEDRPVPGLGAHDVLLEVSHCGVCGSDLHFVLDGWGRPGSIEGHEYSGRVVAVGPDVTRWSVGDGVVGGPSRRCGECEYCRAGRPSLCTRRGTIGEGDTQFQGGFAQYKSSHEAELLALPDTLSLRAAALTEPLAVALHGMTRAGLRAGQRLLVTGAGPIGALTVAAAAARGVTDVVVSEPSPARRALAEALGAEAVTPDQLVAPASPNFVHDAGFDVAIECSGRADAMEAALGQLRRAGTLVLVGAGIAPPRFDPNRILLNELVITGAFTYDAGGFEAALELLSAPGFPVDRLIHADDVPLDGLYSAVEQLAAGEIAAKVMVSPSKGL